MVKIPIVDDSARSRRAFRRSPEAVGHAVVEALDGLAAVEWFAPDVTRAEMDRLEVPSRFRAMDRPVQVVMATAGVQTSARVPAGAAGAVAKPLTAKAALRAVKAVLAGHVGRAK